MISSAAAANATATASSVSMAYTSARSRTRMSQAVGEVQSMSWRDTSTAPPYVPLVNDTSPMIIFPVGSWVFSADWGPTVTCWVIFGRPNVLPGIPPMGRPPPREVMRGRVASMRDTTVPTIGSGRRPGVSAVVWLVRASLIGSQRSPNRRSSNRRRQVLQYGQSLDHREGQVAVATVEQRAAICGSKGAGWFLGATSFVITDIGRDGMLGTSVTAWPRPPAHHSSSPAASVATSTTSPPSLDSRGWAASSPRRAVFSTGSRLPRRSPSLAGVSSTYARFVPYLDVTDGRCMGTGSSICTTPV